MILNRERKKTRSLEGELRCNCTSGYIDDMKLDASTGYVCEKIC